MDHFLLFNPVSRICVRYSGIIWLAGIVMHHGFCLLRACVFVVAFALASEQPGFQPFIFQSGETPMSITRYGTGSTAGGGQPRPFARAVEADGWLYVSGQVPALDGEIIHGGIVEQTHQTMRNVVAILEEAGYGLEDVVRVGVWLEDPRDFWSFNKVFGEYFKPEHAPARACVQASMMVDCKVEIDCVAYKKK